MEPIGFKVVGRFCCVSSKKLYRWYSTVLSGYVEAHENGEIMEHDLYSAGQRKRVPILEVRNMGENMAIDEKHINNDFYTVLTNADTGKIALLAQTMDKKELVELISKFGDVRMKVKSISRDLSPTYDWVCRESFWNASQIADKFHVVRFVLDQLQQVRIYLRQQELSNVREKQAAHDKYEYKKRNKAKQLGVKYKIQKYKHNHLVMSNGETLLELLARSRYLLFKMPFQWTESQKKRAKALFSYCPELEQVVEVVTELRRWYRRSNIGKSRKILLKKLNQWYSLNRNHNLTEVSNIKAFVKRHEGVILNFFTEGRSNAIAEAVNSKIQRFINTNFGIRDLDFFLFRLKIYFA